RRELDRRAAVDPGEGGRDLRQRWLVGERGGQERDAERGHEDPHHASRGRRNAATSRLVMPRGTNRLAPAMTEFMVPFTSTGPHPTARTAWSATSSADIHANAGMPETSTSAFVWNSVRVNPGQTQSTSTPVPRSSAATASV